MSIVYASDATRSCNRNQILPSVSSNSNPITVDYKWDTVSNWGVNTNKKNTTFGMWRCGKKMSVKGNKSSKQKTVVFYQHLHLYGGRI